MRSFVLALGIGAVCGAAYTGCGLTTEGELANAGPVGSSSGAGGGMTDAGPSCSTDDDCPADIDCVTWTCAGGACVEAVAPDGTPVTTGAILGDCKKNVCQGGKPAVLPDDTDLVEDNDPCKVEMCMAGVKQAGPAPDGTACGTTGKLACINGLCEGCNQDPGNCDPADECHTVECQVNTCMYVVKKDHVLEDLDETDCVKKICNAQGTPEFVGDTTETPPQTGDTCQVEVCAASGLPTSMNANEGQECADAAGLCFNPSVCVAGACTPQPKPLGTKLGDDGTPNNCKATYCDGMGMTQTLADSTDLPADPDPADCTAYVCNGDMPGTMTKQAGTGCGMGNKCCGTNCCANTGPDFCDGSGMCCASGKACSGVCCQTSTATCVDNQCCENAICNGACCTSTYACQADTGACCPQNKKCGVNSCCTSTQMCMNGSCV